MTRPLEGTWFDGRSSRPVAAQAELVAGRIVVDDGQGFRRDEAVDAVRVSTRLGRTARTITFADGGVFSTNDNDGVDAWFAGDAGTSALERVVDRAERSGKVAIGAVVAVLVASWVFVTFGLPAIAAHVAERMPPGVERAMGTQVERMLDAMGFDPTVLAQDRRDALSRRFEALRATLPQARDYRLEFRTAAGMANAFALPGGLVIVTDDLAKRLSDDEVVAVLAHEIGHLEHRHVLRHVVQDAGVVLVISIALGDVSAATGLTVAVPTFLLQSHYSRGFETEADVFAFDLLRRVGVSPAKFADALEKLVAADAKPVTAKEVAADAKTDTSATERAKRDRNEKMLEYLSSHPATADRIAAARAAAK